MSSLNRVVTLVFTLALSAVFAHAQTPSGRLLRDKTQIDELVRRGNAKNAIIQEGIDAEARKDYPAAECAYRRACTAMGPDTAPNHIFLARLFDKTGNARKAYEEYRIVVVGDKNSSSTEQSDPRILAHFGDLCARFGTRDDTARAYSLAIANGSRGYSEETPMAFARNDSLPALKAAAHTAAAIKRYFVGRAKDALPDLEVAVQADGKSWIARIWRADVYQGLGRKAEATRDAMLAEELAKGKEEKAAVRRIRWGSRIADAEGHIPPAPPIGRPSPTRETTPVKS